MRHVLGVFAAALCLIGAVPALSQTPPTPSAKGPDKATYITKEEIDLVNKTPGTDRNVKVVDIGSENFAVGIIHRGKTVNGVEADAQKLPPPPTPYPPCGKLIGNAPAGGRPGGITHDFQSEGYLITSGGGTMFTDGYLVNGRKLPLAELNGPTCIGLAYDVTVKTVKEGDVVIIPAGVVHGWIDIPDHVDYMSFRPSPGVLTAGWVHPALKH
jgi:hypothetical protein